MSTSQHLIDSAKELPSGRLEHLQIDLKTKLKLAEENFNNLESLNIKIYWRDLAALLNTQDRVDDWGSVRVANSKVELIKELEKLKELLIGGSSGSTIDEYQKSVMTTAIFPGQGTICGLMYVILGLSNEAGEVAGKLKKALRDDMGADINAMVELQPSSIAPDINDLVLSPERVDMIKKELGDVFWYLAASADQLGVSLTDIASGNTAKLKDRQERGKLGGDGDIR